MEDECEMPLAVPDDEDIADILRRYRRVAVVGLSKDPAKASHRVAAYLIENGYDVVPVNPSCDEVLGRRCHPDLRSVPGRIDVVDIFRPAADVPPIVADAIAIGARAVWMQQGIVNNEAAERAASAGLRVVMNRCMMVEHRRVSQG